MKQGYKTTEFWVTLAGMFLTQAQPIIEQTANTSWNAAFTAALAGIYAIGRSYTKARSSS